MNSTDFESLTAYQLSVEINEDYRAVRKILEDFNNSGIVEIVGQSDNSSKAPLYGVNEAIKENIASIVQAKKTNNASARNKDISKVLKRLQDLQAQAVESDKTIKSLNALLSTKEADIQELKNKNVILDSDLKLAQGQLKMIEDKSKTIESDNARLKQELTTKESLINKQNKLLIGAGAVLLVVFVVIVCYFIFAH